LVERHVSSGSSFTGEQEETFFRLLEIVRKDGGFLPSERTKRLFDSMFSMWAPELVILKGLWRRRKILLTLYDGGAERFRGFWHIPGGYDRFIHPDFEATCQAISKRELGVGVSVGHIIHAHKWRPGEHPYGRPLSVFVECSLRESDQKRLMKGRFFSIQELPSQMVPVHRRFIEQFLM